MLQRTVRASVDRHTVEINQARLIRGFAEEHHVIVQFHGSLDNQEWKKRIDRRRERVTWKKECMHVEWKQKD